MGNEPVPEASGGLRIRLIDAETTPLYLQISQQIKHLITTHQIDDGAQLPAVRRLANDLGINTGTVVQAYRELAGEGLVETARGRGTIVRRLSGTSTDDRERARLLDDAVARLISRARALGFEPADVRSQLNLALLGTSHPLPVVFVAWSDDQAERYVDVLNTEFESVGLRFLPYGIESLVKGDPDIVSQFSMAYTAVTFVTLAPEVERALETHGIEAEIIGVTAEMSDETFRQLQAMSSKQEYTLVTDQRAVPAALAVIEEQSGLRHDAIEIIAASTDGALDEARLDAVVASGRTIIYSFGVRHAIQRRNIPESRLIELRFGLTEATYHQLNQRWNDRGWAS